MSTDLIVYLNYIYTWESESDENIEAIIDEHAMYVKFPDCDAAAILEDEFTTLQNDAKAYRDATVAADAIQLAADAAAVAAMMSWGLGMAEFLAVEVEALLQNGVASAKGAVLNKKLASMDTDIAAKMGFNAHTYMTKYKANNKLIANKAPRGLDQRGCRAILLQFIAHVEQRNGDTITVAAFRRYAGAAHQLLKSDEINKVYAALDALVLSPLKDEDLRKYLDAVTKVVCPSWSEHAYDLLRGNVIGALYGQLAAESMDDIAGISARVRTVAQEAGVDEIFGEFGEKFMNAMGSHAKFLPVIGTIFAAIDMVFNVMHIVKIVEQTQVLCSRLDDLKAKYKQFFAGIRASAKQYRESVSPPGRCVTTKQAISFSPMRATLRNFNSGRRLYAQNTKFGEKGVGASEPGGVGPICHDQIWLLEAQADGSFLINNAFSQRVLFAQHGKCWEDGVGASTLDNPGDVREDQKWYLVAQADGTYIIKNTCSQRRLFAQQGKCWEDGVGASEPGGAGSLCSDQKWYVEALNQEWPALPEDWHVISEA